MPWCDSQPMSAQREEISQVVDPDAHAVLLKRTGWHTSPKKCRPTSRIGVAPCSGFASRLPVADLPWVSLVARGLGV
jgi:hypothetical protein